MGVGSHGRTHPGQAPTPEVGMLIAINRVCDLAQRALWEGTATAAARLQL